MHTMSEFFRRCLIFNKRILRKKSFVALLVMIPLLVAAMAIVTANSSSGVMTVALAMRDNNDEAAQETVRVLTRDKSLVEFVLCDTPEEAEALVRGGDADAAWILSDNMQERMYDFVDHMHRQNAFVDVIQREDSVLLRLAHEKLNAALYPQLSMILYKSYVDNNLADSELTEEQLEQYYKDVGAAGADVFDVVYLGSNEVEDTSNANYLLAPLRGVLAVSMVLGGFAAAMFYMQDEACGVFDRLPKRKRFALSVGYHWTAVSNIAAAVLIALVLTGMEGAVWRELAALVLYLAITVGFCMAFRLLCGDIRAMGALIPLLVAAMLTLCPIFLEIPAFTAIKLMLPPYYYLNAVHNSAYLGYMAIYCAVIYSADYVLFRIRAK